MSTTERSPGRPVAALVGLLAVAAALGAGHLVAGLLARPQASPFLAVGNAAIDRTPNPVKSFAIAVFGTNDKIALLAGMAVVIAVVAAVAGLVSRRRPRPGLIVVGVLGLIGGLAVAEQSPAAVSLLAPLAALATGLAAFVLLHARARAAARPDAGRRGLLLASGGVAAGAALGGLGGRLLADRVDVGASRRAVGPLVPAQPAPPIPPGAAFPELGTPPFLTPAADFYRVDVNLTVPRLRAQDAVLRIHGMVDREVELPFAEIAARPLVERTITMTCVSNYVGGPYVSTANFVGVPLGDLLAEAGVRPDAEQLVGRAVDGFTIGTPLDRVLGNPDALLAIGMNGEPLLPEHGFPLRTVVPGLYGYVSATKWLTDLELTTFAFDPYWEQRGWDGDPEGIVPIKTSSRIDAPAGFARVPAGEVVLAGTSWAPGRGIAAVEVSLDDGPWLPAELGAPVNTLTWRMWYLRVPLGSGLHTATVRATDRTGQVQTAERVDPINPGPDGATGRHTVTFTVA
ncbi:molybdopterin-dependent oxidoreductase [Pseudonocardia sp.]|uniref:molybdopterin-dependent oxidoreductase n=1 Tax=Pseudonocardia sp. TaxID=60912 RepID=UPI00261799A2|nr:molybdopterin-dependent oxidoreductase [Pseudonocardia sp.]